MSETVCPPGIPFELTWSGAPASWQLSAAGLSIDSGPRTDLFIHPAATSTALTAAHLTGEVEGDFGLSALVSVRFQSTYDAGVLALWVDDHHWAKLCFELSPQGDPMVVSVVTRDRSDDANAFVVSGQSVWLRVSRRGSAYAFHASLDGQWWDLVRHFHLTDVPARVGFLAQSPTGDNCSAVFSQLRFVPEAPRGLRDGS